MFEFSSVSSLSIWYSRPGLVLEILSLSSYFKKTAIQAGVRGLVCIYLNNLYSRAVPELIVGR